MRRVTITQLYSSLSKQLADLPFAVVKKGRVIAIVTAPSLELSLELPPVNTEPTLELGPKTGRAGTKSLELAPKLDCVGVGTLEMPTAGKISMPTQHAPIFFRPYPKSIRAGRRK